jgi:glycosyltransferase involved in cell wall biosynthesis
MNVVLLTRPEPQWPSGGDLYNRFFVQALDSLGVRARLATPTENIGSLDVSEKTFLLVDGLLADWPWERLQSWFEHPNVARRWMLNHVSAYLLGAEGASRARSERHWGDACDGVMWPSASAFDDAPTMFKTLPSLVLEPGKSPDVPQEAAPKRVLGRPVRLLCLGAISPHKRPLQLLTLFMAAMSRVSGPRIELAFAGPITDDSYGQRFVAVASRRAREVGDVRYLGPLSRAEVAQHLSASDALVVASHYESFCLSALEAVAQGCPVLCAAQGGITRWLTDGVDSVMMDGLTGDSFAAALDTLIERYDVLRQGARETGHRRPVWTEQARLFVPFLQREMDCA